MADQSNFENRISRQLVGQIASELARLADGQSKPVQLPPERKLAEKFSTGRRAIRLAMEILENRGLIVRRQGSGNYLLPKELSVGAVALIIPSTIKPDDPFFSMLISRFMLYAREHEIQLIPIRMGREVVLNKDTPGIILGRLPVEQYEEVVSTLKTIVTLMEMEDSRCCQIYYDDAAIGREAARQLSIRGHREVLVLAGPGEFAAARERLTGFCQAGQALKLKVLVREGSMNWRGGYDLMSVYLNETPATSRVSAVFTANDWMAAGALQAMVQASVRVPEDMSLIGCDDATLAAELEPPLATFRQDVSRWVEQCFVALEQAWRLKLPGKIVLPAEFVERKSLGVKRRSAEC